jgi:adenylosuccinate synthase
MGAATIVLGLGFGDEGKGTMVDWLARTRDAKLVVRFNGGAQAGHNVVLPDGRHHCFSQWGAGTFAGARTILSHDVLVNPIFALSEAERLQQTGVPDPFALLVVEEGAVVTTQFHVAANRLRELARGGGVHGSCGMGIGETQQDVLAGADDVLRVGELRDHAVLKKKLRRCQERKLAEVNRLGFDRSSAAVQRELGVLVDYQNIALDAYAVFAAKATFVDESWLGEKLRDPGHVLFEGAQGVLLDEDWGFHPHTTWSHCTFANAERLIPADVEAVRLGVLRTFHTRHGAGPFPTESPEFDALIQDDHNVANTWQQGFRAGAFDLVLARYALDVVGGCDALALTHVDKLSATQLCYAYESAAGTTTRLPLGAVAPAVPSLDYQEELGRRLVGQKPLLSRLFVDPSKAGLQRAARHLCEDVVGVPVAAISTGQTCADKQALIVSTGHS